MNASIKLGIAKAKKKGRVALKLDISKAYDKVEWNFLKQVMMRLGFEDKWVRLIMDCITTSSFSVLINGSPKGLITPQRGLRQGCPLSPYLFIICAEALSNLLRQAEKKNHIQGLKFGKHISVSHLFFADDSLIFSKASIKDCHHLKDIFERYAKASGQIFNFEKSCMFFSGKIHENHISVIKRIFQLNVVTKHEKYLGLPSMIGRKKKDFFNEIKLKVQSKISSWKQKLFSSGGKEVLIKAVAQAVPTYAMSVFKIPMGLCNEIQQSIAGFWWSKRKEKRGIFWTKWESMCQAKTRGGMGFRDISSFNQALVAKQGWRLIQNPESLAARIMKARYFREGNFLNASTGSNPSYIWRSLLWGRQVILKGYRWRIGNGMSVLIYRENWIQRPSTFQPFSAPKMSLEAKVAELIDKENRWKTEVIQQNFLKDNAEEILSIPLPRREMEDKVIWHYDK